MAGGGSLGGMGQPASNMLSRQGGYQTPRSLDVNSPENMASQLAYAQQGGGMMRLPSVQQSSQMGPFVSGDQPGQSPQYITNQQAQMIRQGFGRLGLAGVGMGPQQINPMMYDRLAQGFASGQINPGNFQDQLYNVAQTMNPAAATPTPTPAPTAAPRAPANTYSNPFQQNYANQYVPPYMMGTQTQTQSSASKGSLPGSDQVNLGPSQDTMVNRLQDLQLSQISGARPSGERQFFQPVYQAQYENYASPMTAFNVASYGTNPFMAQDIMNRGYQQFYAPPPSFYVQNPAYVEPTPINITNDTSMMTTPRNVPTRSVPGSAMRGITSLLRSGKR
ncbi:MAG: hypothetical protein EBS53_02410 [Bacteroidetes bacterium]|nr:hypothetical protein [Bacteroidota bacterium]